MSGWAVEGQVAGEQAGSVDGWWEKRRLLCAALRRKGSWMGAAAHYEWPGSSRPTLAHISMTQSWLRWAPTLPACPG